MDQENLSKMKVNELKRLAKNNNLRAYSKLKKNELINLLLTLKEPINEPILKSIKEPMKEPIQKPIKKSIPSPPPPPSLPSFIPIEQAFDKAYRRYRVNSNKKTDVHNFFDKIRKGLVSLIDRELQELDSTKLQASLLVKLKKTETVVDIDDVIKKGGKAESKEQDIIVEKVFNSKMTEVFQGSNLKEILNEMFAHINTQIEHPALPKSGFTLDEVMFLNLDFHKLNLTRGSSYIPLPNWISSKKAIINLQNSDNECFKWAVIAALHHEDISHNYQRVSNLKIYIKNYNWGGLEFPMAINKIDKFEKNNPDVAINVLSISGKDKIYICRKTKYYKRKNTVNLLLIVDDRDVFRTG